MDFKERFPEEKIDAVYEAIFKRRDVRSFEDAKIPDDLIQRLLKAAHHAPSVGYMQPWNFIVIRDPQIKKKVKDSFLLEHNAASEYFEGERKEQYKSFKLEGIEEAPVNICVTCDPSRFGPHVIGRHSMPETDVYSVCCAVQNIWLAARAEGVGVGWVSIVRKESLKKILGIPDHIIPVAYLCVGIPKEFYDEPELESAGWANRLNLDKLTFSDRWG
ncbi:Cobalamin biosynthesis protein BluB @ 5,6-dimethylbenzimidazole synthase, flavin destructase family [hydrothermal vent metagenome]|uniref:Cobalamin biosynthesis protein BluB @ 5,6-dimethylbenzimidazole synthase, flavin destructase family n=1 Tax=hydrothermal vent metagenome TaxID=652676 RepID=A0A3B1BK72_9ZZZZ